MGKLVVGGTLQGVERLRRKLHRAGLFEGFGRFGGAAQLALH